MVGDNKPINFNELYHSDVYLGKSFSNELYHWKYISRKKGKNGKWIYIYNKNKITTSNENGVKKITYGNGEYENFKGIELQKVKGKDNTNTSISAYNPKGTNKGKFDVEKKIGAVKLYATRDNYETYVGLSLDNAKIKKNAEKGKKIIDSILKRK